MTSPSGSTSASLLNRPQPNFRETIEVDRPQLPDPRRGHVFAYGTPSEI